jgi:hypothetical protein
MSLNSTPGTWVAGNVVTAAQMNFEVRDSFAGIQAAWDTWAPTLTNFTGAGTWCKYLRIGHIVFVQCLITLNAAPTGQMRISLPFPVVASHPSVHAAAIGNAEALDAGVTAYPGIVDVFSSTDVYFKSTAAANAIWAATVPFTWGNGDQVGFNATYQCA